MNVKGWCPDAHRPMMSGDGLICRIKPRLGRVSRDALSVLADLAEVHGSGVIEITNRANLQLRGLSEDSYPTVLATLLDHGLIDADPLREARRNIMVSPDGVTDDLYDGLVDVLCQPGVLPSKFGIVINLGSQSLGPFGLGDIRVDTLPGDQALVRGGNSLSGRAVAVSDIPNGVRDLLAWYVQTNGPEHGRMSAHLKQVALPNEWAQTAMPDTDSPVAQGVGWPFGRLSGAAIRGLVDQQSFVGMQVLPNRSTMILGDATLPNEFITTSDDPRLRVSVCSGAPACASATVATLALADELAGHLLGHLHIAGCAKGCAHPRATDVTLVGRDGAFDLVRQGAPWDAPERRGLSPHDVKDWL